MPIIRPTSDLRNNFAELSELVHKEAEPVFITKNGRDDMVLMSMALYEQQQAVWSSTESFSKLRPRCNPAPG